MTRDVRFWRNVTLIALAHVGLLIAFVRWNRERHAPEVQQIVWMDAGTTAAAEAGSAENLAEQTPAPSAQFSPSPELEPEPPALPPAPSDISLPTASPQPTPTPVATPKPAATAVPKPKATPKPSPKTSPKSTPKPKKPVPKPLPHKTPSSAEVNARAEAAARKKSAEKAARLAREKAGEPTGNGSAVGSGGQGNGAAAAADYAWYGNMLHDRFYGEWAQPTSVVTAGAKISALVRIRIEKDGRVSAFEIAQPSGNVVVDESVAAVAQRVTRVDPLPRGLGGDHYDVKINFELNPEK